MKRASDNLVKAAQKAAAFQDHDETVVVKEKMVGGIAQVRSGATPVGQGELWLPPLQPCPAIHQHRVCSQRASKQCCRQGNGTHPTQLGFAVFLLLVAAGTASEHAHPDVLTV